MQYRELGKTGLKVSVLGYGASPLGSVYGNIDLGDAVQSVHTAVNLGINFFDVSPFYGQTKAESVLGQALKGIPREAYYLATKVGRYDAKRFDFSAAAVTASVDESLARLGVTYVDVIQCHDIEFVSLDQIIQETLPALRKICEDGKARFIGITGLPLKIFGYVMAQAQVDTVLSYCHYTLYDNALADILPALQAEGVGVISASALGMGLLTNQAPPDWHPASAELKAACARAAAFCGERSADIATLALKFALSNPAIHTTLVGMESTDLVRKNIQCLEEPLDEALLAEVQSIFKPVHNQSWPSGRPENN